MRKTTKTISEPYCDVTVRRPNGVTETVRHPNVRAMTPGLFAQMRAQMSAARRGECLGYVNHDGLREVPMSLAEQRADLCRQLSDALDRYQAAADRAMHSSIGWGDSAKITEIEAEIAAFDFEHPEVVAQINAARDRRAADAIERGD